MQCPHLRGIGSGEANVKDGITRRDRQCTSFKKSPSISCDGRHSPRRVKLDKPDLVALQDALAKVLGVFEYLHMVGAIVEAERGDELEAEREEGETAAGEVHGGKGVGFEYAFARADEQQDVNAKNDNNNNNNNPFLDPWF